MINYTTINDLSTPFFDIAYVNQDAFYFSGDQLNIIKRNSEVSNKLSLLKRELGETLYNNLSEEDRNLIIDTAGSLDFGHPVDMNIVNKSISDYEPTK